MSQYGHFGLPSVRLAAGTLAALLLHFLVPYGYLQFRGPASADGQWLTRGEVVQSYDVYSGDMLVNNASPNLVLAGLLVALVGASLLIFLGFQPLSVAAARWVGAGGSTVAAIGLGLAWMASMYSVGTGFAALLMTIFPTEFISYFWSVGPVITAALCGWLIWQAMQVARRVVATRDGLRDEADDALRLAAGAMIFIAVALIVPWSIGLLPDGISDRLGTELRYDDEAAFWFSAEDVQSVTPAESHGRLRYSQPGDFGLLSASLHVFMATGWVIYVSGWLRSLAATAASAGAPVRLVAGARATLLGGVLMLAASAVMYLLAWIFVKPDGDVAQTFLPGFWPLLLLAPGIWIGRRLLGDVRNLFTVRGTSLEQGL